MGLCLVEMGAQGDRSKGSAVRKHRLCWQTSGSWVCLEHEEKAQ